MFIFGKVLDQLIHATSLKINPVIDSLGSLPRLGNSLTNRLGNSFTNSLTAILFHYSFVRKKDILQRKYSDLYVDVC